MIIDPKARTITFKGKQPAPFRLVSTSIWDPTPPDCMGCRQPTDKMAKISTPAVSTGSIEVPMCSTCLCIYKNEEEVDG